MSVDDVAQTPGLTAAGVEFILRNEIKTLTKMNESKANEIIALKQQIADLKQQNVSLNKQITSLLDDNSLNMHELD